MLILRDNFVKTFVISLSNTKLTTFFNMYTNVKTTYNKIKMKYLPKVSAK